MFTWHISFDVRRILSSHADFCYFRLKVRCSALRPERENDKRASGRGDGRARTGDPLLAKQVLSQLSYIPSRRRTQGPTSARGNVSAHRRVARHKGGAWRGPFWIRTRDLTVISRALLPTELKARVASAKRRRIARVSAGTRRSRSSTAEAWSDFHEAFVVSQFRQGTDPSLCPADSHCCWPAFPTARRRASTDHATLHPVTLRDCSLLLAVLGGRVAARLELTGPRRDCTTNAVDGLCGPLPKRR